MEWNGINIKTLANEKGLSLKQLAIDLGVSRQSVSDWVKGQLPKGSHLVALCKILETTPNTFFGLNKDNGITVPAHRAKANAKVTPERQKYALELATEYSVFFRNIKEPRIVPVIRAKDRSDASARVVATKLREIAGAKNKEPITQEETFRLMEYLGINVIIREFAATIKAYAFYTKVHSYRAVFLDYNTNVIDLNFALLHEAIHAIRDEESMNCSYDQDEEDFCDLVANYIQFPDEYIEFARNTISNLPKSHQINQLKNLCKKNLHALYGLAKQIKNLYPDFDLKVGGADTNFKKDFYSIGDALFANNDPTVYIQSLKYISPVFIGAVIAQYDGISDRKLGELLSVDNILDAKAVRTELDKLSKQRA